MNMKSFLLALSVSALALVPLATADASGDTPDAGPLGECTGVVDILCNPPQQCPSPASCQKYHCFVWIGSCPLTLEDVLEIVEELIGG